MRRVLLFFSVVLLVGGCGPGRHDVSGRVTYPDGQPLTTGQVVFESETLKTGGAGTLRPDGTYSTHSPLPAGTYAVYISGAVADPGAKHERSLVANKYGSPKTSGLTIDIGSRSQLDLVVERP